MGTPSRTQVGVFITFLLYSRGFLFWVSIKVPKKKNSTTELSSEPFTRIKARGPRQQQPVSKLDAIEGTTEAPKLTIWRPKKLPISFSGTFEVSAQHRSIRNIGVSKNHPESRPQITGLLFSGHPKAGPQSF